jgi:hypothetical protein
MPLVSGSSPEAFRQNVSTLMGEIGKSPHVQSREQALAIAYAKQRRGRQEGGDVADEQPPQQRWRYNAPRPPWTNYEQEFTRHPSADFGYAGTGGSRLVDHDNDPDLPRRQDPAQLIDMMPLPRGYEDPAYIQTIYRLLRQQQQLNEMYPQLNTMQPTVRRELLRRYWLGGYLGGYR